MSAKSAIGMQLAVHIPNEVSGGSGLFRSHMQILGGFRVSALTLGQSRRGI